MADLEDVVSKEGVVDWLLSAPDAEKEAAYLEGVQFNKAKGQEGLKRAKNELARLDNFAQALGEDIPEDKPGAFFRFLDTLDTPRQYVAGAIGKLVGDKNFEDLSLTEAALRASELDTTTGDLLRNNTILGKYDNLPVRALRGALGFAGDVLTDPITYVAPFGGVAKKIGMVSASKLAVPMAKEAAEKGAPRIMQTAEQIFKELSTKHTETMLDDAVKRLSYASKADLPEELTTRISVEAASKASKPFEELAVLRDQVKKNKSEGLYDWDKVQAQFDEDLRMKAKSIADEMGVYVADDANGQTVLDTLNMLVQKPSFKLTGPLAGLGGPLGRIPLLSSREMDIPGVTKASEILYAKLAESAYNIPVKIKNKVTKSLEEHPESLFWRAADNVGEQLSKTRGAVRQALGKLSIGAQASGRVFGSRAERDVILENVRARGALELTAAEEAKMVLRELGDDVADESVTSAMIRVIEQFPDNREEGLKQLRFILDGTSQPQLAQGELSRGMRAAQTVSRVEALFEQLAATEKAAGVLDKTLDNYITRTYLAQEGADLLDSPARAEMLKKFKDKTSMDSDFRLARVFKHRNEAKAAGYRAETNLEHILTSRIAAHKLVMAEKDFAERFAYQMSMSPEAYEKLSALAISNVAAIKNRAAQIFRDQGIQGDDVLGAEALGVKFIPTNSGNVSVTPDQYKYWDMIRKDPSDPGYATAMENINKLGLDFDRGTWDEAARKIIPPEVTEIDRITKANELFGGIIKAIPGRYGEDQLTRAGATTMREFLGVKTNSIKEDPFWDGLVPRGFADAYKEAVEGKGLLAAQLRAMGKGDRTAEAFYKLVGKVEMHKRWMQKWVTLPWPAYWARNVMSAAFQPGEQSSVLESVAQLAQTISPWAITRNKKLLNNPKKQIMSESGELLTYQKLAAEMNIYGMTSEATMADEIAEKFVDAYSAGGEALGDRVKLLGQALREKESAEQLSKFGKWKKAAYDFGNSLETYGRQHAYIDMRLKGMDASSAAAQTHRLMIDYKNGKTEFERVFMNPLFFFYAFSRGNATNQALALMRRPGSMTTQLHAFNGAAELMIDPNNYQKDMMLEDELRTLSAENVLSRYIGNNPETGLPRVMKGAGLPMEDAAKYINMLDPFTRIGSQDTWSDAMIALGDAGSDALKIALSQTNPLMKGILETFAFKKNLYFDRPITDETLRKIPSWERDLPRVIQALTPGMYLPDSVWSALDEVTKTALGGKDNRDGTITINPYAMAFLVNFVPGASRFLSTRAQLTAPGVAGEDKLARLGSGVRVDEVDPEKSIIYDKLRRRKERFEMKSLPTTKRQFEEDKSLRDEDDNAD